MNLALCYVDDVKTFASIPALCRQLHQERPAFLLGNGRHLTRERIDGTSKRKEKKKKK